MTTADPRATAELRCELWLPCHKYAAPYLAEEVLYLCDICVLEVQP